MARIGFIGAGEIASAMVRGLAGKGHSILVSERNAQTARTLADTFGEVAVEPNQDVLDGSDVVILCLLKPVGEAVLPDLRFRAGHSVISVMVDVTNATLRARVEQGGTLGLIRKGLDGFRARLGLPPIENGDT